MIILFFESLLILIGLSKNDSELNKISFNDKRHPSLLRPSGSKAIIVLVQVDKSEMTAK